MKSVLRVVGGRGSTVRGGAPFRASPPRTGPPPSPRLVRLWFIFVFYCTCRKTIMQLALINERVANGAWSATTTIIGWLIAQTKRKCRIVWDGTVITSARVIKNERVGIELGEQLLTDFVPFPPPPVHNSTDSYAKSAPIRNCTHTHSFYSWHHSPALK